jgi:NAD(P)-dependent dehydrogenase (short-subunit alcohol dehydrogenase family)
MPGPLDGRVAVITGGGRGIGRAFAHAFAAAGASVVISARTTSEIDAVAAAIAARGGRALAVTADATDRQGAREPVRVAQRELGACDIVVNNVGGTIGSGPRPFEADDDSFEATILLNLTSSYWTTSEALPHMRERGFGRVINIGSGASRHASGSISYTAAKHGLVGLTKQLALGVAGHGITVNCLCPGWTNTSLVDFERIAARSGVTAAEAQAKAEADNAQRRILEPEELAPMAVLLCSDAGAGITGQVISVDGGYRL